MTTVLVTGSTGFIGQNLIVALKRRAGVQVRTFDIDDTVATLETRLRDVDVVFHLAGVNRPQREEEFESGNAELTRCLATTLTRLGRAPRIVMSSSTQAALENPYGRSKRAAEEALRDFGAASGADVRIYRLPGVFGKWSRPNYNTVVATFCHNVANGLPLTISDPATLIDLVYVDDVVSAFLGALDDAAPAESGVCSVPTSYSVALGDLADRIRSFRAMRTTLVLPDLSDELTRRLYTTYVSFLPTDVLSYPLERKTDARGTLVELLRSAQFGQMFFSTTKPGVTRGNHYHDSKVEKFCVLKGSAVIRFRHVREGSVIEYPVSGEHVVIVDIPPGYVHSIENVGSEEMIVLFWANEPFDSTRPDTNAEEVLRAKA